MSIFDGQVTVARETVSQCLGKAYNARMSSAVRYKNMDTELSRINVRHKDLYTFLVKQYKMEGIEVKEGSTEERAIHLYQDHVKRFFRGSWDKVKDQPKRVAGKVVITRKSINNKPLTEKRVESLIKSEDNLKTILSVLEKHGYKVVKG